MNTQVLSEAEIVVDFVSDNVVVGVSADGVPTRHPFSIEYGGGLAHEDKITVLLRWGASDLDLRNARKLIEDAQQGRHLDIWTVDGSHMVVNALYIGPNVNDRHYSVLRPCLLDHCTSGPHIWRNGGQDEPCVARRTEHSDYAGEWMVTVALWPGADAWTVYADALDLGEDHAGLDLIDGLRTAYADALELMDRLNSEKQGAA